MNSEPVFIGSVVEIEGELTIDKFVILADPDAQFAKEPSRNGIYTYNVGFGRPY
jgi:hypothetical protein